MAGMAGMAVVDPARPVRGLAGLRVIEAPVMPESIGANRYAPAIMSDERESDRVPGQPA